MRLNHWSAGLVVIACLVLIGQAVSYANPYHYSFHVEDSGGVIGYSIVSNSSQEYTAVSIDNGGMYHIEEYVAFCDPEYPMPRSQKSIGGSLKWIGHYMGRYGLSVRLADGDGIKDIVGSLDTSKALIFCTGALPSEIYSDVEDGLFRWLEAGGVIYWMDGKIGAMYSVKGADAPTEVPGCDALFFNADDVVRPDAGRIYGKGLQEGSLTHVLGAHFNECTDGLEIGKLSPDSKVLDYSKDGYASVALTRYHGGSGMICVFGGHVYNDTAPFVAQVMASGLTYGTEYVDHRTGRLNEDPSGTLGKAPGGSTDVFIYVGKTIVISGVRERI